MKFKLKQVLKMFIQHIVYPFIYFINKWKKVDTNLVMLADAHHETCPPHMQEIKRKLIEEKYEVREFFRDVNKLGSIKSFISLAGFMSIYPKCGTVIICDNFLPVASCKKKKTTKVIQLWHGCGAFKKFGYDAEDDIPKSYKGNVYKNYDLITVSGPACVPFFESAMKQKGVVKALGVCHTDRLYDAEYVKQCKDNFIKNYPEAAGKKVVLWTPTFRGNASDGKLFGETEIDAVSALEEFSEYYFIKSIHPHLKKKIGGNTEKTDVGTEQLICCADILITDYSSVFFETLLMDIPIIFFAPDYEVYASERGFYLEYEELPGVVAKNTEELKRAFEDINIEKYKDIRTTFIEKYMQNCDGKVCDRVTEFIAGGH